LKGDVINIEEHHYRVAKKIVHRIQHILNYGEIHSISVAGESGSGKSETAKALQEEFEKHSLLTIILQQDDYFELPPKTNDRERRVDINRVGPHEVRLELMDEHIKQIKSGIKSLLKPLVLFDEDVITEENVSTEKTKIVIVEGTYTSLLKNIDHKIFIARSKYDTLESRKKRSRAAHELDDYANKILEKEHEIISGHISLVNTVISKTFDVKFLS
jgi:uridine kinase